MATDTKFVKGAQRLSKRIKTISATLALPVLVNEIGATLLRRTLDRFDREVDPDDNPWKANEASTLKRRGITNSKKKILVESRSLRDAIRIIKGGSGSTFTNTGAGVRIGIDANVSNPRGEDVATYGRTHQQGLGVPQRRFLGVGRRDVASVDAFLRRRGNVALED